MKIGQHQATIGKYKILLAHTDSTQTFALELLKSDIIPKAPSYWHGIKWKERVGRTVTGVVNRVKIFLAVSYYVMIII